MQTRSFLLLFAMLILYITIGGVIFRALEQDNEVITRLNTTSFVELFLEDHPCVSREELEQLLKFALERIKEGVVATDNSTEGNTWSLHNAIFFSTTVVTTIGYGNISPATTMGQVFCIFFALSGIPLCLIFLGEIGIRISKNTHRLANRIKCLRGRADTSRKIEGLFLVVSGVVLFILIPSILFSTIEKEWNYGQSIYYSIITLTTVGFGDFVAGQDIHKHQHWYRMSIAAWILLGLAWMATVLSVVQDSMADLVVKPSDKRIQNGLPTAHTPSPAEKVNSFLSGQSPSGDDFETTQNTTIISRDHRLEQSTQF